MKYTFQTAILTLLILIMSLPVFAAVPQLVNFQGRLTDTNGDPVEDNPYLIKFIIYDAATGGNELWNSGYQTVNVADGLFEVKLGESPMPALPDDLFDADTTRYLGITVGAGSELAPRTKFTTAAFAYKALRSDSAGIALSVAANTVGSSAIVDGSVTASELSANCVTSAKIVNSTILFDDIGQNSATSGQVMKWSGSAWAADDDLTGTSSGWVDNGTIVSLEDSTDRVGIGTTSPNTNSRLHVDHDYLYAGLFNSSYPSSSTHIVHAEYNGSAVNADVIAVYGKARTNDFYGIGGFFEGGYRGVFGYGLPTGSLGPYIGVYGSVGGGSGTNYGVYGYTYGSGTNFAGYFDGNVHVTGTLSKGGGSFKIDHPLDPENKYLQHSFVESPDMMNVYNGNVELDANGETIVKLPDYFEVLNRDFRYQLTAIGAPGPNLYIAQEISGNSFRIAGGEPGMKVSWQVTGIRHDKWAEANRIQVEVDKPAKERGLYLHPEAYGLGEEKDIHYEMHQRDKQVIEERK